MQRLRQLQSETVEAKEAVKETEALLRTWEVLVSKAHQIPLVGGEFVHSLD